MKIFLFFGVQNLCIRNRILHAVARDKLWNNFSLFFLGRNLDLNWGTFSISCSQIFCLSGSKLYIHWSLYQCSWNLHFNRSIMFFQRNINFSRPIWWEMILDISFRTYLAVLLYEFMDWGQRWPVTDIMSWILTPAFLRDLTIRRFFS